jgi:hypothetical protein
MWSTQPLKLSFNPLQCVRNLQIRQRVAVWTPLFYNQRKTASVCGLYLRKMCPIKFKSLVLKTFAVFRRGYKGKGLPQQSEVAQGVPGRLRPRIFLTFGTTRVVGRQPYAPAASTPGEIPGTRF